MNQKVLAPSVGESVSEVSILKWHKADGQAVKVGEVLLEIESDKATVEVAAETAGVLQILKQAGERIPVGAEIGSIDPTGTPRVAGAASASPPPPTSAMTAAPVGASAVSAVAGSDAFDRMGPAAKKISSERGIDPSTVAGTGRDGRVTKGDLLSVGGAVVSPAPSAVPPKAAPAARPGERRVPMTLLRQKIAERLVQAQHTAAILTTFNEVDMGKVMELRKLHKDKFQAKFGVPLSFMSFFSRAAVEALKALPGVNARIEGTDVVYNDFVDLGIAVGTERGLVVPVIRGADKMGFVEFERALGEVAAKARNGKLSIADMSGGTFTISNGGTYGSLLSTPILNPPQSGILGMHKIMDRPMAVNGKIEIRPMMYLALSYDHRLIDGKEAVTWLVALKDHLENPEKLGLGFINEL